MILLSIKYNGAQKSIPLSVSLYSLSHYQIILENINYIIINCNLKDYVIYKVCLTLRSDSFFVSYFFARIKLASVYYQYKRTKSDFAAVQCVLSSCRSSLSSTSQRGLTSF